MEQFRVHQGEIIYRVETPTRTCQGCMYKALGPRDIHCHKPFTDKCMANGKEYIFVTNGEVIEPVCDFDDEPTDLDRFLAFYEGVGIKLTPTDSMVNIVYRIGDDRYGDNGVNQSEKFDGYSGFYSEIEFTKEGEFVKQGFWE